MAQQDLNMSPSPADFALIQKIAQRAHPMLQVIGAARPTMLDIAMDVTATHLNGQPLRLRELLAADYYNFFHDIHGIRMHLDRETGKLQRAFTPRFAASGGAP